MHEVLGVPNRTIIENLVPSVLFLRCIGYGLEALNITGSPIRVVAQGVVVVAARLISLALMQQCTNFWSKDLDIPYFVRK